jgi:hypothetical protein
MSETRSRERNPEEPPDNRSDVFERLDSALQVWRARIDELVVQLDLATLDGRDEVRKKVDIAQNVFLAAHSKLSDARTDARSSLASVEEGLGQLLRDLGRVFEEAEAVIRRGRQS